MNTGTATTLASAAAPTTLSNVTGSRHRPPRAAVAGALLVLVGLASWALYAKSSGDEAHAYSRAGPAPAYVQVVAGHTYRIAIRGGVGEEIALGVDPASLACTAARPDQAPEALHMTYDRRGVVGEVARCMPSGRPVTAAASMR